MEASADELADDLAAYDGLSIAALNTPTSTVISGPTDQVAAVAEAWVQRGRKTKALTVSHAFHSVLMEPMLEEFEEQISSLTFHQPTLPLISNLTGEPAGAEIATPAYWARHIRQPVHFAPAITHLAPDTGVFLELGPDPVLATATQRTLDHEVTEEPADSPPLVLAALNRRQPDVGAFTQALARLHVAGRDVEWPGWFPADAAPRTVPLPTYAFQREWYWLNSGSSVGDVGAAGLRRVEHGLLPAAVALADGGLLLSGRVTATGDHAWLADHRIGDAVLVPGAALVEWALRAADEAGCGGVDELVLQAPLVVPEAGAVQIQVVVGAAEPGEPRPRDIWLHSRPDRADRPLEATPWTCHARGTLSPRPADSPAGTATELWPPTGATPLATDGFYERVAGAGYGYGPAFQGVRAVWRDGDALLAEIELPDGAGDRDGFGIHPALLDAALHPGLLLDEQGPDDGQVWLPFSWSGVTLWATGATTVRTRLTPLADPDSPHSDERGVRVELVDASGAPVLSVSSVAMRRADLSRLAPHAAQETEGQFVLEWTPLPTAAAPESADEQTARDRGWTVLGPDAFSVAAADSCHADTKALLAALDAGAPPPDAAVVCVPARSGADAAEALATTGRILGLLRDWLAEPRLTATRLVVVTRGAVPADAHGDEAVDVEGATVWGLMRSAQTENPDRFLLVDLDPGEYDEAITVRLAHAVSAALAHDEPQTAVRGRRVLVPRLVRAGGSLPVPTDGRAWRLGLTATGTVENVTVVPSPAAEAALGAGEVRIAVGAAGVNFRDVLIALGMYPGGADLAGSEGAGSVLEVGPEVTHLAVGDRVMGVFDGTFGPVAVADARMLVHVPEGWDDVRGAAVPVTFLTAWFGLRELGRLRPGESVLVHAATGGVGTAAVQIARHVGAEVFATASPGKHGVLAEMGIDAAHRASSRDLAFEEAFRQATGGRGVDVVLNSLAGEFTDASLRLLAEGGRFVEMGKTDVRDGAELALEYPKLADYHMFDLVPDAGPERVGRMLLELRKLFVDAVLKPAPVRAWPLTRAREALRYVSGARHVGKVVLRPPAALDPDGTVLVTGGTGALGALVAEHLVRSGRTRHVVLTGRRGPDAPGAAELVERLAGLGATAHVVSADVTDMAAVSAVVAAVDPAHPLTGVVHAAGVVDDGVVPELSGERLGGVWGPKAAGAYHLHRATVHLPLAVFVVLSSAAGSLGSAGQANYAAANAFCDALVAHRRAQGLAGLSVGWGLWAESSGMAGGLSETDLARMARSGMGALSSERGLALFDSTLADGRPHLVAADIDPRALAAGPPGTLPAVLRALVADVAAAGTGKVRRTAAAAVAAEPEDWRGRLAGLSAAEQQRALLALVRGHVATVLGHADADAVPADAAFKDLGFDSLTAVELRNRLGTATGLRLPPALIFDYPRVGVLADELRGRVAPPPGHATDEVTDVEPVLDGLARLAETLGAATGLTDGDAGAVTARLEGLLAEWKANRAPAAHGLDSARGINSADKLDAASADELLDIIDSELGAP
ncbi:SDR family NAD(P)-dependent oxidoreductase [Streptomyces sp. NPDC047315]|uniref:SDR family NAD(P)-dependent oxidoreductase n=1 Tax=Streptomyces sp. NPDC047315 TaxID=3155142 RepID=UPI0033EBD77C